MVTSTAVAYRQVRHSLASSPCLEIPFCDRASEHQPSPCRWIRRRDGATRLALGWVITRFAHRYLQGEAQQARFVTATLFTLSCVALLVTSQHLLVIVLAWSGTSVGLHRLLTFYPERKAARVVAHKNS